MIVVHFLRACDRGDLEEVKKSVVKALVDPAIHENAPLLCATRKNHYTVVDFLLSDPFG